ncbi:MAG: hypothetical protein AB2A00_08740 [Myxococcota bacterium]
MSMGGTVLVWLGSSAGSLAFWGEFQGNPGFGTGMWIGDFDHEGQLDMFIHDSRNGRLFLSSSN